MGELAQAAVNFLEIRSDCLAKCHCVNTSKYGFWKHWLRQERPSLKSSAAIQTVQLPTARLRARKTRTELCSKLVGCRRNR
jgi:hypothetical protein